MLLFSILTLWLASKNGWPILTIIKTTIYKSVMNTIGLTPLQYLFLWGYLCMAVGNLSAFVLHKNQLKCDYLSFSFSLFLIISLSHYLSFSFSHVLFLSLSHSLSFISSGFIYQRAHFRSMNPNLITPYILKAWQRTRYLNTWHSARTLLWQPHN